MTYNMYMIKKKNFGYCDECNKKILVPSWKLCADCDFNSYKKIYLRRQVKMYQRLLREEQAHYKNSNHKNARTLLIDENGKVIGYKSKV